MTAITREIAYAPIKVTFMQSDAAVSQTNVALTVAEVRDAAAAVDDQNAVSQVAIPFPFDIVAISASASAARTAGTLTVEPSINGTGSGFSASIDATNTQWVTAKQPRGSDRGVAGDRVGCVITTTAAWAPATADVCVEVWIVPSSLDGI